MSKKEAPPNGDLSWPLDLPDERAIAEIRLILALAILVAVSIIPPAASLSFQPHYVVIAAYIGSSLVLYWVVLNAPGRVRQALTYWLDAGWLLAIISLAGNTGSPLFLLLLFPILVAAAQAGFMQGMTVAVAASAAYVVLTARLKDVGYLNAELLLQAGILLVLGFMVSRWAGAEADLKRKLNALNRLGKSVGLREDPEPFWQDTLKQLATYFGAESAFVLRRDEDGGNRLHACEAGQPAWSMALGQKQAAVLAGVPERWAICWRSLPIGQGLGAARVTDVIDGRRLRGVKGRLGELTEILDSRSWLSFPVHTGETFRGRIFLLGIGRLKCKLEWEFVQQLAGQISLKLENLVLAGQLARAVASGERERISRDLHDGTVQPYLGLRFGLEALRRKVPDHTPLAAEIDELLHMTDDSILQLRGYIHDLRNVHADDQCQALSVIRAQVQQFETYSGLEVDIRAEGICLSESALLEVRQIIGEGLSNIRRHTNARKASIDLVVEAGRLRIAFINPVARTAPAFTPRSLAERAATMGGAVTVVRLATETIVKVVLPLWGEEEHERHAYKSHAGGRPPKSVVGLVQTGRGRSAHA